MKKLSAILVALVLSASSAYGQAWNGTTFRDGYPLNASDLNSALGALPLPGGSTAQGPMHMGGNLIDGSNVGFTGGTIAGTIDAPASIASPPVGVGQSTGTATLPITAAQIPFYGFDGTQQAAISTSVTASEYVNLFGGITGAGGTVRSESATSTSPNLNLLAKGSGDLYLGNDNGNLLHLYNNPAATTSLITANAAITNQPTGVGVFFEAEGTDTQINVGLIPKGANGAILARKPDNTATGGNAPGAGAIDLQMARSAATQVASGVSSVIIGGANNTASNTRSTVIGSFGSFATGSNSAIIGGNNANDLGRFGWHGYANGIFNVQGDTQFGDQTFRGKSTGGGAVRLTANASAADGTSGTRNCDWMATNSAQALRLELVAVNFTTTGHTSAWFSTALLAEGANAAATTVSLGTATTLGTDTQTVSVTADTTIGCVNVTVTPPNSDEWHYTLHIAGPEVK